MQVYEYQILLIDDDEDDFVNLRGLFEEVVRSKYTITWKPSYQEGLQAFREKKFDACLLDYRLGEHTGIDLLKEVHKMGIVCPIIILTGHGDFDLDIQAMQFGASEYLVKGQLTAPLLERAVRYSMKHSMDMEELKENKALILQQDRLASLGLLASSLAHEIGTPLGIIRSRAELVERRATTNETTKQDMITVVTQIDRIAKLVNSLLHLARGKQSDLAAEVNLSLVVQDVLNLMQHEFDRKGIALHVSVQNHLMVKAESGPLGQVLLNLLVNAVHAIEEAKAEGRTANHQISLTAQSNSSSVELSVEDSGCGIPDKNLSQLFKPFFTTKDIGMGTGLGLATSFKLVHSWNGAIDVISKGTAGTIFKVCLKKMTS